MIHQLYLQYCAQTENIFPENVGLNAEFVSKFKIDRAKGFHPGPIVAKIIRENKNDAFVGIYTKDQAPMVENWMEKEGLEKHITFRTKKMIHNWNYPSHGPKLHIVVFGGKVTQQDGPQTIQ